VPLLSKLLSLSSLMSPFAVAALEAGIGAHILLTDGWSRALPCAALRQ
jgi:hypothetical protein